MIVRENVLHSLVCNFNSIIVQIIPMNIGIVSSAFYFMIFGWLWLQRYDRALTDELGHGISVSMTRLGSPLIVAKTYGFKIAMVK